MAVGHENVLGEDRARLRGCRTARRGHVASSRRGGAGGRAGWDATLGPEVSGTRALSGPGYLTARSRVQWHGPRLSPPLARIAAWAAVELERYRKQLGCRWPPRRPTPRMRVTRQREVQRGCGSWRCSSEIIRERHAADAVMTAKGGERIGRVCVCSRLSLIHI